MKKKHEQNHQSTVVVVVSILLKAFTRNMNAFSLKSIGDFLFVIIEKIIVQLPTLITPYITYYEDIVENEIALAHITKQDTVLHVGCGSVPSTSLLIAQKTGASTVGIDKNIRSVQNAQYCVHAVHQENQIQVYQGNALTYSIQPFRCIIVSQGIEPRHEVLDHIAHTMGPDTKILYRTFSSEDGGIPTQDAILRTLFTVENVVPHPQHGILISVLLHKKTEK